MIHHDQALADLVSERRRAKGWSQATLARHARSVGLENFHPTTVSRVESGDRRLSFGESITLARLLDLDLSRPLAADSGDQFQAGYRAALQSIEESIGAELRHLSNRTDEAPSKEN